MEVDTLIDSLIEREGGFANHPSDRGGPTNFGITEAVARAHGYSGAMRNLPRSEAAAIYKRLYWLRPRFDQVARRSEAVASELFDSGVNMGPAVAATFLQRALSALNRPAGLCRPRPRRTHRAGDAFGSRHVSGASRQEGRRNGPPEGARCASGRAVHPPCRAPPHERGLPLRMAGKPDWLAACAKTLRTVKQVNFPSGEIQQ